MSMLKQLFDLRGKKALVTGANLDYIYMEHTDIDFTNQRNYGSSYGNNYSK